MRHSDRYVKIVQWSDEDRSYVGLAPGLMFGGCNGDDEMEVYREICQIVDEVVEDILESGDPLPAPTIGMDVVDMIWERAGVHISREELPAG